MSAPKFKVGDTVRKFKGAGSPYTGTVMRATKQGIAGEITVSGKGPMFQAGNSFGGFLDEYELVTSAQPEPTQGGTKHDSGKPPLSMCPRSALDGMAQVFRFGAAKYGRDNYRAGFEYSRLIDASLRHITAYSDGEDLDPESGLSHLYHALCSLAMLVECQRLGTAKDDRYRKGTLND